MHSKVIVESSARLHLGFYNIISKNVAYGSLGVAISEPKVVVSILKNKETTIVNNTNIKQLEKTVLKTINMLKLNKVKVVVEKAIPRHVGLGSTTQLMLSIGYGISHLYRLNYSIRELAVRLRRGTVSGIGIATFEKGGFIIDSGRIVNGKTVKSPTKVEELPQIIYRKSIPKNWFFTVVIPKGVQGLTEKEEKEILSIPEPMDKNLEAELRETVLLHLLPSLARVDIEEFGKALTKIQILVGTYFAKYQGGIFCCEETEYAINSMLRHGVYGAGQSSWGPTAYGIVLGLRRAKNVLKKVKKDLERKGYEAEYYIVNVRNRGAKIVYS